MSFYKACLGGALILQAVEDSQMADRMRQKHDARKGLLKGNATSIMLNCSTEAEVRELFDALSEKGKIHHPIKTTFGLRYLPI